MIDTFIYMLLIIFGPTLLILGWFVTVYLDNKKNKEDNNE